MKRTISLWLGLVAFALLPAFAQTPADQPTGKIHGHVTNPTGEPQTIGTVSLSTDGGATLKFTFPVSAAGDYAGEAAPGTYAVVYRDPETAVGKIVDAVTGVEIKVGQDVQQNIDMSRQEFINKMSPEQKKQVEELKKSNAASAKANAVIGRLNADVKTVSQDKKDIENAITLATQALGAGASVRDIQTKAAEIRLAKYAEIERLMSADTAAKSDEAILWTDLGFAQIGLKKFDAAIASYKKALDLETASKTMRPEIVGIANAGIGEAYAHTGKVSEANAAYEAAAKADPARAAMHLRNQAVIFFQERNADAEIAAADEALKVDANQAILYYIKGQGLIVKATVDPTTQKLVLSPECIAAYQKYLALAPNGPYAARAAGILTQAGQKLK